MCDRAVESHCRRQKQKKGWMRGDEIVQQEDSRELYQKFADGMRLFGRPAKRLFRESALSVFALRRSLVIEYSSQLQQYSKQH